MWPVAMHQLLLSLLTGIAAADSSSAPARRKIKYADINPFRGDFHGLGKVYDVLKCMHKRSVTRSLKKASKNGKRPNNEWFKTSKNLVYWVVADILRQESPVNFAVRFFGHLRLAECRMLVLIFDSLNQAELETAYKDLIPAMVLSRAEVEDFRAKARSEPPNIRKALNGLLNYVSMLSPNDFIASYHSRRISSDIIAYISLRCERNARPLREELPGVLDAVCARAEAIRSKEGANLPSCSEPGQSRIYARKEKSILTMFIHRLLSLQLEKDRSKPVIFSLALNHMASHYNRGFIELLTSSLVRNSNMGRILNYICASNAKDADPHFVRGYLEAQRKNGKITEEQEVVYLHTYYSNCGDAKRGKLLAVDDKFPESLPYEFRQRVCDSLYEEACTKDSGIAAVMQAKYDSNPDRNDRSRHMAKIDAYLEFYRPTVEPTNAEQGVACSPSMGMAESP